MLEETLLDLKEIPGEHSGENLADAVWETLELYGLCDKVTNHAMITNELIVSTDLVYHGR
jgi:hypothetical protein